MSKLTRRLIFAAALLTTPAHAAFYSAPPPPAFDGGMFECSIVNQSPPPRRDNDPVYKITVNIVLAETMPTISSFSVVHTVRSGREYDRSEQYVNGRIWQTTGKMEWSWTGERGTHTKMIGSLFYNNRDGWMYREGIMENGRLNYTMLSDCHAIGKGE